jgi:hypothetical protein
MAGLIRQLDSVVDPAAHLKVGAAAGLPSTNWLGPDFGVRHPMFATLLRRSILSRCYFGDYHADVHDEARLAQSVARGEQRILFWGEPDVVAHVEGLARRHGHPDMAALDGLAMGTHTVLPGEVLYGAGHLEVARTGSTHGGGDIAARAIGWDLGQVLAGDSPLPDFHTVSCVPRNRRSMTGVPGGVAIHRIHTRVLGTSHWGVAPFYMMAGGFLELLDYRELTVDDGAVTRGFAALKATYLVDEGAANLVRALCRLNGFDVECRLSQVEAIRADGVPTLVPGAYSDPHGPRVTHVRLDHPVEDLTVAVADRGEACSVAVCDLEDQRSLSVQAALLAQGFRLSYLSPPKVVARQAAALSERIPLRAGFVKIRSKVPLAQPFYLQGGPSDSREVALIREYRQLLRHWTEKGLTIG